MIEAINLLFIEALVQRIDSSESLLAAVIVVASCSGRFPGKPIILSGDDFQSVKVMMSRLGTCLFFTTRLTRGNAFEIDHYLFLDYLLFGPVWAT